MASIRSGKLLPRGGGDGGPAIDTPLESAQLRSAMKVDPQMTPTSVAVLAPAVPVARADNLTGEGKEAVAASKKAGAGFDEFSSEAAVRIGFPRPAKAAFVVGAAHGAGQLIEEREVLGGTSPTRGTRGSPLQFSGGIRFSKHPSEACAAIVID